MKNALSRARGRFHADCELRETLGIFRTVVGLVLFTGGVSLNTGKPVDPMTEWAAFVVAPVVFLIGARRYVRVMHAENAATDKS